MIRDATPDDTAAAIDVVVAAGMFPAEETAPVEQLLSGWFGSGAEAGHGYLVDADDRDLHAVAYYKPKPAAYRVWDLTMIAVAPGGQGRGRGRALLAHIEDRLRADDQRLLLVETSGTLQYDRARAFYVACGYDQVARVEDYWEPGDDLVLFRKRL